MTMMILLAIGLLLTLASVTWAGEPGDAALATLQDSLAETGKSLKTIGTRLDGIDKNFDDQSIKTKAIEEQYKKIAGDLEATRKALTDHVESTRAALKALPMVHSGGHDVEPVPVNSCADGSGFEFRDIRACKAFGLFLMARMANEDSRTAGMKGLEKADKEHNPWAAAAFKALSANNNTAGGVLIPEEFMPEIIRNVETHGHFTQNARRLPMSRGQLIVPKSTGELTVYYPEENVNINESAPTFGEASDNARLYATLTKWSNTFAEDCAIDFGSFMAELITFAHAKARDLNGFRGDGSSAYARVIGAMNAIGIVTHILGNQIGAALTNTGKTAFGALAFTDLVAAQALIPTKARPNAKWYCHRFVAGVMRALVDNQGRPIFTQDYVNGKRVNRILGDELVEVDVMPYASAAATDFILYGDLRLAYGYGEPRQLRIVNSQEAGFAADQTWLRSTARVGIAAMDGTQLVRVRTSTT